MEKHLILIDLDGTLLQKDQRISDYNIKVINRLQELGHKVIIVTGRAYYRSSWFYDTLGLDTVFFNRNSGHIHHPHKDDFIEIVDGISLTTIEEIMTSPIANYFEKVYFEYKNRVYVLKGDKEFYLNPQFKMIELIDVKDYSEIEGSNLLQFFVHKDHLDEVENFFSTFDQLYIAKFTISEEVYLIQLYPVKSNKEQAIVWLSDYYDVPISRIIAMGDAENDIDMIRAAGIGVAMKNAIEEVKDVSDRITEYTHEESGVGHFLAQYFELED